MKFQFIADHRDEFPVIRMCDALEVSKSGYYAWRGRPTSEREMANEKWLSDITYIAALEGWLCPAAVLDLFSRRIVGCAMSNRMTSELKLTALHMAIRRCRPDSGYRGFPPPISN